MWQFVERIAISDWHSAMHVSTTRQGKQEKKSKRFCRQTNIVKEGRGLGIHLHKRRRTRLMCAEKSWEIIFFFHPRRPSRNLIAGQKTQLTRKVLFLPRDHAMRLKMVCLLLANMWFVKVIKGRLWPQSVNLDCFIPSPKTAACR